jgi:hypothetical protein
VQLTPEPAALACADGAERVHGVCAAPASPVTKTRSPSRVAWSIGTGSAGIVGIGIGTVFGLMASSTLSQAERECPTYKGCSSRAMSDRRTAGDYATVSTVTFIAGGVLLAGGVTLYFTAPRDASPTVGLDLAPGSVSMAGRF